jgi:hypothetical protein
MTKALAGLLAAATLSALLAGCASSGIGTDSGEAITPIQNVPVASTNLAPIQGGATVGQSALPPLAGQPQTLATLPVPGQNTLAVSGGVAANTQTSDGLGQSLDPMAQGNQQVAANGQFVTLDSVGQAPVGGRDLTGGLTIEKLLGVWTIVADTNQCKLNLTYTQKTGTTRYRASTPSCALPGLAVVASWQLAGSQVQLFDEAGDIVASLILSDNRFVGTLAGGQGISMVG